jgi:sec-independent protein translocase protein TatA
MNLGAPELIIILIVVLLLFGSTRLPKLARSLGQASKEFKKGINDGKDDDEPAAPAKDVDTKITMTRAELDAMLAERERQARGETPPPPAQG